MKRNAFGYPLATENTDVNALCRRVFNPHAFVVEFRTCKPALNTLSDSVLRVRPEHLLFLPHGYYSAHALNADTLVEDTGITKIRLVTFFGKDMSNARFPTPEEREECRLGTG